MNFAHPAAPVRACTNPMVTDDDAWASQTTLALRADGTAASAALTRLHAARHTLVARIALAALPARRDLALDAAQETWLRIARRPAHCRSCVELDAWLRRIVLSAAIDLLRRELRQRARIARAAHQLNAARNASEAPAPAPPGGPDGQEALAHLRAQLEQLAADERLLLDLRFRAGMTLAQIADALGIGPAAAESRLRRTLTQLRTMEDPR